MDMQLLIRVPVFEKAIKFSFIVQTIFTVGKTTKNLKSNTKKISQKERFDAAARMRVT